MNKQAIERGLFRSVKYSLYKDEERTNGADAEKFENPSKVQCTGMKVASYDKLGSNGFVAVGTTLTSGDVIIGKEPFVC